VQDFPHAVEDERRPSVVVADRPAFLASSKRQVYETASLLAR